MTTTHQNYRLPKKPLRRNLSKQKENVEVFCRIRPLENDQDGCCIKKISQNTVVMTQPDATQNFKNGATYKEGVYNFQQVFDETMSQDSLFEQVALPLVDDLLHAKNALLFAYGVTSSGKTFTMNGIPSDKGILPRCLDCIFNSISAVQANKYVFKPDKTNGFDVQSEASAVLERQSRDIIPKLVGTKSSKESSIPDIAQAASIATKLSDLDMDCFYSVFISYVEVYNSYVYDLLEDDNKAPSSKNVKEDSDRNVYVSGAMEIEVMNAHEALEYFMKGQKRRKVACTALNSESSRSHSIFNIRVVQGPADPKGEHPLLDKKKLITTQLSLVDLAGCERIARTGTTGDRVREAGNINNSLMTLRACIEALRENQKLGSNRMVPYREQKLTNLFKSYFEGRGKVSMIVCVNPRPSDYDETLSVMKFGELAQDVQIATEEVLKPDLGLPEGRRMENQMIKEAIKAGTIMPADMMHAYSSLVYNLGPAFPKLVIADAYDEHTLPYLAKFLKERHVRRTTLVCDLTSKEEAFRAKLMDMERELIEKRQAVAQLQQRLKVKDDELIKYSRRFADQERMNESLNAKVSTYEKERLELEREVGEKNWTIVQEKLKRNMLQMDFNARLVHNQQQYSHNMEQQKRKFEAAENKVNILKSVINAADDTPRPRLNSRSRAYHPQLEVYNSRPVETPARNFKAPAAPVPFRKRTKSPPVLKPKPMGLEKTKRRSKSTDALWIQHKPLQADTGTILQPNMKTLKSVMKLNEKDIRDTEASKYLLTHQGYDSNGEFATKFVKGDIMQSVGGGASVIFTDVEVVKQKSPGTTRKRRSSSSRDEFDGSWTDVETRCHVALEGHAKRTKCSEI